MTRTGKIARLPREIREQLNRRLHDGEPGKRLVGWLNTLPEVKSALAAEFGGRAVSEQNLSEWKRGGYREWLGRQELLKQAQQLAVGATEIRQAVPELTEHLAAMVSVQYAAALNSWKKGTGMKWTELRSLRMLSAEIVELRRGDHSAARLKLEYEKSISPEHRTVDGVLDHFLRWMEHWKVREIFQNKNMTAAERRRRLKAFFHLTNEEQTNDPTPASESDSIQPNQTHG